ncbi:DUF397 domain-containing protein [Nocardia macrotermitis]|uniref:DUF397 domain-containing protein n=1 Tax=Nocardia macrotermitis TaxID=2585198 RepID=A0A7K0D757_9NOCA|nr:DUF397 domain-containing protein [Nocardia macrotermitis]MQY21583.1 hypothetical protein [Nocardia macrotermitis]
MSTSQDASVRTNRSDWFKSSFSKDATSCVEVRFDGGAVLIRDSKYLRDPANDPARQPVISVHINMWSQFLSNVVETEPNPANSVPSIGRTTDGGAIVRDAHGTALVYTAAEWDAFTAGLRAGEFSLVSA